MAQMSPMNVRLAGSLVFPQMTQMSQMKVRLAGSLVFSADDADECRALGLALFFHR